MVGVYFNGRPEKAPDVCYSWWILSALRILGKMHYVDNAVLTAWICDAQDCDGGIADRPGNFPDVFHTFFGLAGFSLLAHHTNAAAGKNGAIPSTLLSDLKGCLKDIDPVFALPVETVRRLGLETTEEHTRVCV
eukprot:GEMP01082323.1.p1 GENE.GEMP01082323.1~~GEMP01082323.1.p1  ORF type:complete len:134 (+),score=30.09 GEMP01082323.1:263-664(+)